MRKKIGIIVSFLFILAFGFLVNGKTAEAANHTQDEAVAWANAQVGKGLDYDGVYGNQCVDLIKYYYDYLGAAGYANGNACDYRSNALPSGWQRVYSSYQPGDIAVWKPNYTSGQYQTGAYGHVGIVTGVSSSQITVINQNFANQSTCTRNTFPLDVIACCIRPSWGSTQITVSWSEWVENITENSASINARINVSQKVQFTAAGVYIWDSSNKLIYQGSENTTVNFNYMNIFYNIQSELGVTLSPGQNYTYQMFADFGGQRYLGNKKTFKTAGNSSTETGTTTPDVSWSEWVENITENSADIKARINISQKVQFTAAGVYIWDSSNKLIYQGSENTSLNFNYMNIFYNIQSDLGVTLSPGQNYTYQMFADFGGQRYLGNKKTFKTTENSSAESGTTEPSGTAVSSSESPAQSESSTADIKGTTALKKLTAGKKKITVKWKKAGKQITGYQIQYSRDENFQKGVKLSKIKNYRKSSKTIGKLKAGKTYYVRIRTYKKANGKTYYSEWSAKKSVRVKR